MFKEKSVALLIFFVPYVVCQLPGVSITRIIRPRIYLPSLALAWGIVLLVKSHFFLGDLNLHWNPDLSL